MEKEVIHIVGCGESAKEAKWRPGDFVIGVNDCEAIAGFNVDWLVVVNHPEQFEEPELQVIESTKASSFITHSTRWSLYGVKNIRLVQLCKWRPGLKYDSSLVYNSKTSPFVALSLAATLQPDAIVFWGVDFNTHQHFKPGTEYLREELDQYHSFIKVLEDEWGFKCYKGSETSQLNLPIWKEAH